MSLGEKVTLEVGKVIGDMAIFFVKKQCRDLGFQIDGIKHTDLPILADRLEKAVSNFTSIDVANEMKNNILALPNT